MQDKELWKTFEKTGSIVDYLSYRSACGDNFENQYREDEENTQVKRKEIFEGNKFL